MLSRALRGFRPRAALLRRARGAPPSERCFQHSKTSLGRGPVGERLSELAARPSWPTVPRCAWGRFGQQRGRPVTLHTVPPPAGPGAVFS